MHSGRASLLTLLALLALPVLAPASNRADDWYAPRGNGSFSTAARKLCDETPAASSLWSPGHRRRIAVRSTEDLAPALFAVDDDGRGTLIDTAAWTCPQIGWSAAADRFFVVYSDGGAVGTWRIAAYRNVAGKWRRMDLETEVRRDFLRGYPRCFEPETPNVTALAWSRDGKRLLLAAQVLPHSNCDDMGTFSVYEVAVPGGAILRRFDQRDARTRFGKLLGPELRAADDECVSRPGSCFIPALHGQGGD